MRQFCDWLCPNLVNPLPCSAGHQSGFLGFETKLAPGSCLRPGWMPQTDVVSPDPLSLYPKVITQEGVGEKNYKSSIKLSMKPVGKFYSLQHLLLTVVPRQDSPCLGIHQGWPVNGVFYFYVNNSLSESQSTLARAPSTHISLVLQWHNFSRWLIRPIINVSPSSECGMLCKLTDSKPQKVLTQLWLCFYMVSAGQWCSINLYHCLQTLIEFYS